MDDVVSCAGPGYENHRHLVPHHATIASLLPQKLIMAVLKGGATNRDEIAFAGPVPDEGDVRAQLKTTWRSVDNHHPAAHSTTCVKGHPTSSKGHRCRTRLVVRQIKTKVTQLHRGSFCTHTRTPTRTFKRLSRSCSQALAFDTLHTLQHFSGSRSD